MKTLATIVSVIMICVVGMARHISLNAQSPGLTPSVVGRVRGTVLNYKEGAAASGTIFFESERTKQKIVPDESGSYEVELPAGVYQVKIIALDSDLFYPFKRAPFRVLPGSVTVININSLAGRSYCSANGYRFVPVDLEDSFRKRDNFRPPRFDSFPLRHPSGTWLELVVEYCKKRVYKNFIVYEDAVATYDALTIIANSVRLNKRIFQLEANGSQITVEDGGGSIVGRHVKVNLKASRPTIALEKGAISEIEGSGAITEGDVTFSFVVNRKGLMRFVYEDQSQDIKMVSTEGFPFNVISDARKRVEFSGSGAITSHKCLPYMINDLRIVDFTVVIQDNDVRGTGKDTFSIRIPALNNYYRIGTLSQGNILVHRDY